jgi:hypothetical protein
MSTLMKVWTATAVLLLFLAGVIGYQLGKQDKGVVTEKVYVSDSTSVHKIDSLSKVLLSFKDSVQVKSKVNYINKIITRYDTNGRIASTITIHDTSYVKDSTNLEQSSKLVEVEKKVSDSTHVKDSSYVKIAPTEKLNSVGVILSNTLLLDPKASVFYTRQMPLGSAITTGVGYELLTKQITYSASISMAIKF